MVDERNDRARAAAVHRLNVRHPVNADAVDLRATVDIPRAWLERRVELAAVARRDGLHMVATSSPNLAAAGFVRVPLDDLVAALAREVRP